MIKVSIIGEGNVATHLGKKLKVRFSKDINKIDRASDVFILAVKDDAIAGAAKKLQVKNKIIFHTSGSVNMDILKKYSRNFGVLYPLQTFSKKRKINLSEIPVCVEGSNKRTEKIIFSLASRISGTKNVHIINSKQRKILHLSAVFANNFSNHMFAIAESILKKEKLPFDLLKPLILETANKACQMNPREAQTGPARRKDKKIIQEHLKMLSQKKNYRDLYKRITSSISQNENS